MKKLAVTLLAILTIASAKADCKHHALDRANNEQEYSCVNFVGMFSNNPERAFKYILDKKTDFKPTCADGFTVLSFRSSKVNIKCNMLDPYEHFCTQFLAEAKLRWTCIKTQP